MTETREVVRCLGCALNQFMTASTMCRKCGAALLVPEIEPDVELEAEPADEPTAEPEAKDKSLAELFARNLVRLRGCRGWSQKHLAERMGVPRTYISKLEGCRCLPSLDSAARVAAALGVPLIVLLEDSDEPVIAALLSDPFISELAFIRLPQRQRDKLLHLLSTMKPAA